MADTFFEFDPSLNNGDHILPPDDDDDCLENEEEYDALNDETFGGLENTSLLDDWEQQHEQFAEFTETSRNSGKLEDSIRDLVLDNTIQPLSISSNSVWAYKPPNKNGDISILSSLQKASESFIASHTYASKISELERVFNNAPTSNVHPSMLPKNQPIKKICTVEELEKNLIKISKNVTQQHKHLQRPLLPPPNLGQHLPGPHPYHPMFQHHMALTRLPPGLPPITVPPPMRHMPPPIPPPGFRMLPAHPFLQNNGPPRPPGLPFPYPINHPNYPPHLQRNMTNSNNLMNRNPSIQLQIQQQQQQQLQQMQQQQHHRTRSDSGRFRMDNMNLDVNRDDFDGLMSMREKQWLLNIQLLQLNTGTPYFDDYYYTVFKERKVKNNKENFPAERNKFQNSRQHRNSESRQEISNPLTPRIYTPLQFENSLGKLQCGSVTAPRKIIDMDVVTCDKDSDSPSVSRDTRKTKQLLLELEALYTMLLKAEDLANPMAINNLKTLRDIKQKQRLRELDLAMTTDQKQDVLELFMKESEPIVENQNDYIIKILAGFLQEDKFTNFLNIRKGKMLLLRLLPHLGTEEFSFQVLEIFNKVLLSLPIIGRRDTTGDNILPKLYPFFKRFIQTTTMSDILDIIAGLVDVIRQENSRSTPLSHQGKAPLYFVLLNKFGVSALAALFTRAEYLISVKTVPEKYENAWYDYVSVWADLTGQVSKVPSPLEPIPMQTFTKHCARITKLTPEQKTLLKKHFVEENEN